MSNFARASSCTRAYVLAHAAWGRAALASNFAHASLYRMGPGSGNFAHAWAGQLRSIGAGQMARELPVCGSACAYS